MYKAISIRQPYAFAIVKGYKPVENRSWSTSFRGPVLIHAARKEIKEDVEDVLYLIAEQTDRDYEDVLAEYESEKAFGCIVGAANITDCVTQMKSDWFCGPFGFVFSDATPCKPTPCKGQLGFFAVPPLTLRY